MVAWPNLGKALLPPPNLRCDHGYIDLSLFLVSFENNDITAMGRFGLMMNDGGRNVGDWRALAGNSNQIKERRAR